MPGLTMIVETVDTDFRTLLCVPSNAFSGIRCHGKKRFCSECIFSFWYNCLPHLSKAVFRKRNTSFPLMTSSFYRILFVWCSQPMFSRYVDTNCSTTRLHSLCRWNSFKTRFLGGLRLLIRLEWQLLWSQKRLNSLRWSTRTYTKKI